MEPRLFTGEVRNGYEQKFELTYADLRPAHTHCSFNLIGEPVKVFVKAAIHVAFDLVCSQIADQRRFRCVSS